MVANTKLWNFHYQPDNDLTEKREDLKKKRLGSVEEKGNNKPDVEDYYCEGMIDEINKLIIDPHNVNNINWQLKQLQHLNHNVKVCSKTSKTSLNLALVFGAIHP